MSDPFPSDIDLKIKWLVNGLPLEFQTLKF